MEKLTENFEKQLKVTRVDDNCDDGDEVEVISVDYDAVMNAIDEENFYGKITDIFVLDDIDVDVFYHGCQHRSTVKKDTFKRSENEYFFKTDEPSRAERADNATFYFNIRVILVDENGDENTEDTYVKKETSFNW
ncbi:MAG: hypothetical protein RR338_03325 [Clostridia bacterium]